VSYEFTIPSIRNREIEKVLLLDGQSESVSFDFAPWEADNDTVSAVVWTVENGDVSVSGESLGSSVASAVVTGSSGGKSLVKLVCTAGSLVQVVYFTVYVRDPDVVVHGWKDYI
jgi:hypothetical protein